MKSIKYDGGFIFTMWILTVYQGDSITMYEFEDEKEAREAIKNHEGTKILSQLIHYSDLLELSYA